MLEIVIGVHVVNEEDQRLHLYFLWRPKVLETLRNVLFYLDRRIKCHLIKPFMRKAILGGDARLRILIKHLPYEVLGLVTNIFPVLWVEPKLLFQNITEYFGAVITFKWRISA